MKFTIRINIGYLGPQEGVHKRKFTTPYGTIVGVECVTKGVIVDNDNRFRPGMCRHRPFNTSGVAVCWPSQNPGLPPGANEIGRLPASDGMANRSNF